ncbi:hypothetical protein [Streptomyces cinereoruber]|uniref:hypothetical protein n=1 Tax=Streptomyces cinereoruber TaxID=67260 RepID=UPI00366095B7
MSTKSRSKGTRAESEVVRYLQNWWPTAERRALSGNKDKGDVAGIPGVVVEVKAAATQQLAAWTRETWIEMENAEATCCVLVVKRPYKAAAQWDAYVPAHHLGGALLAALRNGEGAMLWLRMDLALAAAVLRNQGY